MRALYWRRSSHYTHFKHTTMRKGANSVTAQANVISMGDAREARRRRVAEESRVSSEKQKAKVAKAQAKAEARSVKFAEVQAAAAAKEAARAEKAAEKAAKATTRGTVSSADRVKKPPKHAPATVAADSTGSTTTSLRFANSFKFVNLAKITNTAAVPAKASVKASSRVSAEAVARASERTMRYGAPNAKRTERAPRRYVIRGVLNNLLEKPMFVGVALFCTLIVLAGVFLYPTARTYYQAIREQQRLEAEFSAVLDRNIRMADEIEFLQTDEGIIQEARESLGWVERGEIAVIVYGAVPDRTADLDAPIIAGSIEAPETWYSRILDPIFGVK